MARSSECICLCVVPVWIYGIPQKAVSTVIVCVCVCVCVLTPSLSSSLSSLLLLLLLLMLLPAQQQTKHPNRPKDPADEFDLFDSLRHSFCFLGKQKRKNTKPSSTTATMTKMILPLTLRFLQLSIAWVVTAAIVATPYTSLVSGYSPQPIDGANWPDRFPAKEHCSRCGLCETTFVAKVEESCAFLGDGMSRMDTAEERIHGRARDVSSMVWKTSNNDNKNDDDNKSNGQDPAPSLAEEARFGVLERPVQLAKGVGISGAQWTGCVTAIALSALESGLVDGVVCIAGGNDGSWSSSEPILAKTREDVLRGRGVKPALAPSLRVLDEIKNDPDVKRLLFCGVGCAVQAFRAVQDDLGLESVFVVGTNCADNSPTPQAAEDFIRSGVGLSENKLDGASVQGYEFMQDFRVHVKTDNGPYVKKPYFTLPGTIAEASIAPSCLACFDYTNGLADVVVGYMGAPLGGNQRMDAAPQTLTVRNDRGAMLVDTAIGKARLELLGDATGTGSHEAFATATVNSDSIVLKMIGGKIPEKGMPGWIAEIMATVMTTVGPKGVNFARYSIDYHILRNYLHVLDCWGEQRTKEHLPQYAWEIVKHYLDTDDGFRSIVDTIKEKALVGAD